MENENQINPIDYAKYALSAEMSYLLQGAVVTAHSREEAVKDLESVSEDIHRAVTDAVQEYSQKVKSGEYDNFYVKKKDNVDAAFDYLEEKYGKVSK